MSANKQVVPNLPPTSKQEKRKIKDASCLVPIKEEKGKGPLHCAAAGINVGLIPFADDPVLMYLDSCFYWSTFGRTVLEQY